MRRLGMILLGLALLQVAAIAPISFLNAPTAGGGDITTSLVAWYKMDENTGTSTTADSSGNSLTATLNNSPSWTTAQIGVSALSFNGSNQYLTISGTTTLKPSTFTIAAWVKDSGSIPTPTARWIVSLNQNDVRLIMADSGDGHIASEIYNGSGFTTLAAGTLNVGAWNHVVVTYDGSTQKIYLNGTLSASGSATLSWESTASSSIGATQGGSLLWNGKLDDVRIYSRPLSQTDIDTLYAYR